MWDTYVGIVDSEFEEDRARVLVDPSVGLEPRNLLIDGSTVTPQLSHVTPAAVHVQLAVNGIWVDVLSSTICVFVRTGYLTPDTRSSPFTLKTRKERRNWTELNWTELTWFSFDELINAQEVMHYSRHRQTASVAYVTTLTYASTNDQWACSACPKTKPCQFSSVKFSYVFLYAHNTLHFVWFSRCFMREKQTLSRGLTCSSDVSTRYSIAEVGKRVRSTSLYHSRQCSILLIPRSDLVTTPSFVLSRTTVAESCENSTTASWAKRALQGRHLVRTPRIWNFNFSPLNHTVETVWLLQIRYVDWGSQVDL